MSPRLKLFLILSLLAASSGAVYGQGLKGEYFPNTLIFAGQPALTRVEIVNFNWAAGSPGDPIGENIFSARWTGSLTPPETGEYIFATRTDDGVRLWVGGELVIDNWTDHSATVNKSQAVVLEAGEAVAIKLEYYESGGDAVMELSWSGPGIAEQFIPATVLSPTPVSNVRARKPKPANGALTVNAPLLEWVAGDGALFHDVYLGTSPNLTEADRVATRQPLPLLFYYHIPQFTPGTTYYWRVDEIAMDGVTVATGKVWTFVAQAMTAYYPKPTDRINDCPIAPVLTWLPGVGGTKHQLYFSDSLDAVTQGAADANKGFIALLEETFTPGTLDSLTTYYWRVDEVQSDGSFKAGPIWSFTTCLPVDDFESYTPDDGQRIYQTWNDKPVNGSGAYAGYQDSPFTEGVIIHNGLQSMPLDFNNINAPFYSEVDREFSTAQDWTVSGANTLILYVRGKMPNPPTQLYVTVEDSSQRRATVKYPDPAIANTILWNRWAIPLTDFAGVSTTRIKKIYIGMGDKNNPVAGGAGLMFIDDICVVEETPTP